MITELKQAVKESKTMNANHIEPERANNLLVFWSTIHIVYSFLKIILEF